MTKSAAALATMVEMEETKPRYRLFGKTRGAAYLFAQVRARDLIHKNHYYATPFREIFAGIRGPVRNQYKGITYCRETCFTSLLFENSNIALVSDGYELWVTLATNVSFPESGYEIDPREVYGGTPGKGKISERVRLIARSELKKKPFLWEAEIRKLAQRMLGCAINSSSFRTKKGYFVIIATKEGVKITFFNRTTFKGVTFMKRPLKKKK